MLRALTLYTRVSSVKTSIIVIKISSIYFSTTTRVVMSMLVDDFDTIIFTNDDIAIINSTNDDFTTISFTIVDFDAHDSIIDQDEAFSIEIATNRLNFVFDANILTKNDFKKFVRNLTNRECFQRAQN